MRTLNIQRILGYTALILVCSCGKKPQAVDQSSPAQTFPDMGASNASPRTSKPSPVSSAPSSSVAVPNDASAALSVLTQAVRKFSAEHRRVPASLDEVLRAGYVSSFPPPPAGKKYVLNPKRLDVTLANK